MKAKKDDFISKEKRTKELKQIGIIQQIQLNNVKSQVLQYFNFQQKLITMSFTGKWASHYFTSYTRSYP